MVLGIVICSPHHQRSKIGVRKDRFTGGVAIGVSGRIILSVTAFGYGCTPWPKALDTSSPQISDCRARAWDQSLTSPRKLINQCRQTLRIVIF